MKLWPFHKKNIIEKDLFFLNNPAPLLQSEEKIFQYVLVNVDETKKESTEKLLSKICELGVTNSATIGGFLSSLVVLYYGITQPNSNDLTNKLNLVSEISTQCGKSVRILHGECNGLVGTFGCKDRFFYGALIPNFVSKIMKLIQLPYGNCVQEDEKDNAGENNRVTH